MPVSAFATAEPPSSSMVVTMTLVARQNTRNTACAARPHRARTISMAMTPNRSTWMVAPLAYQKGPLTPYCHATFELCRIVAAHVHCSIRRVIH